ncbi:MAG: FAD-binding protein [Phycisphaerales bacterium]|nr:FAD-binding protein [Phycisphaerales bacterium]
MDIHTRRRFLGATMAAGAGAVLSSTQQAGAAWNRLNPIPAGSRHATLAPLADFPEGIPLFQQNFENWSGEIKADDVWTCQPATRKHLIKVVNWAARHNYRIRARGYSHNWSPLVIAPNDMQSTKASARVVLVDMTAHFTAMEMSGSTPESVTVEGGASMESLLAFLEDHGCGVTSCPAPGDLSVGAVLAIDGHGTGIPATGESRAPGQTFGSISNRVLKLKVIAWDPKRNRYRLRTFRRSDEEMSALLVALGRTIVVEATLQVESNQNLRCESYLSISGSELFAPPGSSGQTIEQFLDDSGRIETIWYPFTDNPWLKVWTITPSQPWFSNAVDSPYNYPFSDNISNEASELIEGIVSGATYLAPQFGQVMYAATWFGLLFDNAYDLWGPSKNLLLYVRPTTLRVTANGYAILTRRDTVQQVLHEFVTMYQSMVQNYADDGNYPINGPMEIRVTGIDRTDEVDLADAAEPALSALAPDEDHADWDVAVWLDLLTIPGTDTSGAFYSELEEWMFTRFDGTDATIRVEWSKGWGYTESGPWTNHDVINDLVPESLRRGRPSHADWDHAIETLNELDPHGVLRNPFLDRLMPKD